MVLAHWNGQIAGDEVEVSCDRQVENAESFVFGGLFVLVAGERVSASEHATPPVWPNTARSFNPLLSHMPPIQLPPQPPGLDLPAQPHDPPTLADVVAAKSYQTGVDVAVGWLFSLLVHLSSLTNLCSNPDA